MRGQLSTREPIFTNNYEFDRPNIFVNPQRSMCGLIFRMVRRVEVERDMKWSVLTHCITAAQRGGQRET